MRWVPLGESNKETRAGRQNLECATRAGGFDGYGGRCGLVASCVVWGPAGQRLQAQHAQRGWSKALSHHMRAASCHKDCKKQVADHLEGETYEVRSVPTKQIKNTHGLRDRSKNRSKTKGSHKSKLQ